MNRHPAANRGKNLVTRTLTDQIQKKKRKETFQACFASLPTTYDCD
jgi:hypothetical protein